jgi:hypothetical protein
MVKRVRDAVRADAPPPHCGGADVRLQRIMDYVKEASEKRDALDATLGAVNGDLLLMARRLRQELDDFLNRPSQSTEELLLAQAVFDQYLRLAKQIDRFAQLDIKLRAAGNEGSA